MPSGELIRDRVVAILGHSTSSMAEATLAIADEEHVLMMSPTVSSPLFSGRDDWLVLLDSSAAVTAREMAAHAARRLPGLQVSIVYDLSNGAYSNAWRESFGRELQERGGHVSGEVAFHSGRVASYGALADEAFSARPDAVLMVANALDTAMLAQQLRKRSQEVQLLGTGWSFTAGVLEHGDRRWRGPSSP